MKFITKFTVFITIAVLSLQSCKKDETSEKGTFAIDGVKSSLSKCYIIARGDGIYNVGFVSDGINVDGAGGFSGSGDICSFVITSNPDTTVIESGNYIYDSYDNTPFTYFDFSVAVKVNAENLNNANWIEPENDVIVKVENQGRNYKFSANGLTEDGDSFSFSYYGPVEYIIENIEE